MHFLRCEIYRIIFKRQKTAFFHIQCYQNFTKTGSDDTIVLITISRNCFFTNMGVKNKGNPSHNGFDKEINENSHDPWIQDFVFKIINSYWKRL